MKCKVCGFESPPGMKFCGRCGNKLVEKEFGERRNATVFFADISGYTRLSEVIDPEEIQEVLGAVFSVISESVTRYSGVVNKYIGDCALCVFGFPKAVEGHQEMALASLELIYSTLDEIFRHSSYPIKLHTGVASGLIVTEGQTIIGDTVNIASRLQEMAKPGEILVNADVWQRLHYKFDFEEVGEITLKGKANPVAVYRFLGRKKKLAKSRGLPGIETPLVGRGEELKILNDAFGEYQKCRTDTVVVITGDAGIGKSRLLNEFKKLRKDITFIEGNCHSYETETLYPLITTLKRIMEFGGKDIFIRLFPSGKIGELPVEPFVDFILTGEVPEGFKGTPPDRLKQQKFFVLEQILRRYGERGRVVISYEDLHWADEVTLDFLRFLLSGSEGTGGIFCVFTSRPPIKNRKLEGFYKSIGEVTNVVTISLHPFSYEETKELIGKLLEVEGLTEEFRKNLIFMKSGGNPLFIEETLKILIDKGVISRIDGKWVITKEVDEIPILPSTIEEIFLGLVDQLNEKEKEFLRVASVIGETFTREGVEGVIGTDTDEIIDSLVKTNLIVVESTKFLEFYNYRFRHILMRESVYNSILRRHRRYLHNIYANWLEQILKGHRQDIPFGIIADHFDFGDDKKRAFVYNEKAALRAEQNYYNREALRRYERALVLVRDLPEFKERVPDLHLALGRLYTNLGENELALKHLDLAFTTAKSDQLKCKIFCKMGDIYQRMSDYDQAYYYFSLADSIAEPDSLDKVKIAQSRTWINYLEGNLNEFKKLIDEVKQTLANIDLSDEVIKELARIENFYGVYYSAVGDIDRAMEHYFQALNYYELIKDVHGKAVINNNMGDMLVKIGRFSNGLKKLFYSYNSDKMRGNYLGVAITANNIAECYFYMNQLNKAEEFYNEYLTINKKINNRLGDGYAMWGMGNIAALRNQYQLAEDYYRKGIDIFDDLGSEIMKKNVEASLADIFVEKNREETQALLESISSYAERHKLQGLLMRVNLSYIKYHLMRARLSLKEENLRKAIAYLKRSSGHRHNILYQLEWSKLNLKYWQLAGDEVKIKEAQTKLRSVIDTLMNEIDDEEDRRVFLSRSDLKEFLSDA